MKFMQLTDFPVVLKGVAELSADGLKLLDKEKFRAELIDELVHSAVFARDENVRQASRWVIWEAAQALGIHSASIHDLYMARGKEEYKDFCVPAVNIRGLTYETARAMFRAAAKVKGGPMLFEIAKSEMEYTEQRPAEYVSCILAAAIKENWQGPVCIQGDHFQVNHKKYEADPAKEVNSVKALIEEAVAAGFYNIDIDTSTLVDLDQPTVKAQQRLNYEIAAELTAHVRNHEPQGVTVSVGGEIGEVGGKNSTVEELEAYLDGYRETLNKVKPGAIGISKISIQTGTSHGGVPLPDGSVAQVALDFGVLENLGKVARQKYGLSGAVQHGASTLPDSAFNHFKTTQTAEVHLATGFQNLVLDHPALPKDLKERMYAWLKVNCAKENKPGQTEQQFFYKTRKKVYGPYKCEMWRMAPDAQGAIMKDLEAKFSFLFEQLGVPGSKALADKFLHPKPVKHAIPKALGDMLADPNAFGLEHGVEVDAPGAD